MNDRGHALVAGLRAILAAVDDGAVRALGTELGVGPPTRVSSEDDAAITVVGPHREEDPSGEGAPR